MALSSRLAIITGGLGGIGTAVGKLLHAQGARLALFHAPFESAQVAPVLERAYGIAPSSSASASQSSSCSTTRVRAYECDITSPTAVADAFAALAADIQTFETPAFPSILVNAAGYVALAPLEDVDAQDVMMHLNVNVLGPLLAGQAFARLYFRAREMAGADAGADAGAGARKVPGGRIVNIASQAAHVALHHHGAYCASKAALLGLTRCQASEWGPRGITANTISPGPVMTALGQKAWADPAARASYIAAVPTGEFAEPEEVAEAIAFLCREEGRSVNGADLRVDGGFTVR